MSETSGRLLRLLSLLQAHPLWSGPDLAERLEVTTRTVRRDVERLRLLGYPVDGAPGPDGGYRLGPGAKLPPLLLDDDEAIAVAIGLRMAADGTVNGLEDASLAAITKLDQVLPSPLAARVHAVQTSTVQLWGRDPDRVDGPTLVTLAQGCRQSERVRFSYLDRAGRRSERLVEPYRLVRFGARWYLVARDVRRRDWRTFRVDRAEHATLDGQRFTLDDPPDPAALVARAMAVAPYPVTARIRIPRPVATVADIVPRTVGVVVTTTTRTTTVDIGGTNAHGLARYIASLPVPCTVLDPPEVRVALRHHVTELLARNQP